MRVNPPDDIMWIAMTIWQEAQGEPYEGKLAVAYVIRNRMKQGAASDAVLAPWQFSAWNTDSPTRLGLDHITPDNSKWLECHKAACSAVYELQSDPSKGASHYLNKDVVVKTAGKLPSWYDEKKVTAVIGRHTFLKLQG